MIITNREDAFGILNQGDINFKFLAQLDIFSKFQLMLTTQATKGIEIFGIGPTDIRFGYIYHYADLINQAFQNNYRVIIIKDTPYFSRGDWFLKFIGRKSQKESI